MRGLVTDNSVTAVWCFADESNPYTEAVFRLVANEGGMVVPALWPCELVNAMLVAERRGRINAAEQAAFLNSLEELEAEVRPALQPREFGRLVEPAQRYRLTAYDASYLDLAIREGLPLATQDRRMRDAAQAAGVKLFTP